MEIPKVWSFEGSNVAESFDSHVKSELPWYDLATWAVSTVGAHYIPENGVVYDIGASTGNMGKSLADTIKARNAQLIAIEREPSMMSRYDGGGEFILGDAIDHDYKRFDFACVFLTMMFMPISRRRDWLDSLIAKMNKGGAIVVFDKMEAGSGFLSTAVYRMTLDAKVRAGVDPVSIIQKELSLKGVQRPLQEWEVPSVAQRVFQFGDFFGCVITQESTGQTFTEVKAERASG